MHTTHKFMWNLIWITVGILLMGGVGFSCDPQHSNEPVAESDAGPQDTQHSSIPEHPTWSQHIRPLVQEHCSGCHHPKGPGYFDLSTYTLFKKSHIATQWNLKQRRMPPWYADEHCQPMRHSRRLNTYAQQTLLKWFQQGMQEGNKTPPIRPRSIQLKRVDQTFTMSHPYTPSSSKGKEEYRCFILTPSPQKTTDIIGFHVQPKARQYVHHVLIFQIDPKSLKGKESVPGQGWPCYSGPGGKGSLLGTWVPGSGPVHYPKGTGIRLNKEHVVVLQIHYAASGTKGLVDQTKVQVQWAHTPIQKRAVLYPFRHHTFEIPARTSEYTSSARIRSPGQATIWGVMPHMHELGLSIRAVLQHADGRQTCLVHVPKWNPDWQQTYFYRSERGIPLRKDDILKWTCSWRNNTDKAVRWGDFGTDEMCFGYLYLTQ